MEPKIKRTFLTKTVHSEWYRRYAKILSYEDRTYMQPLREIREERRMLKDLQTPPNESDRAIEMSQKLTEAKNMRIKLVLQMLEGNTVNVDLSCLKPTTATTLLALPSKDEEQKQVLFWRQRAVRPPGYVLSPHSKWRLFWENPVVMKKFEGLVARAKSDKIRAKWIRALRLIQCVHRFTEDLAELSGTTAQVFKDFFDLTNEAPQFFQKDYFKAQSVAKNLNESVLFTLTKPMHYRKLEDAHEAATALRLMQSFAEFPVYLQDKICLVSWYLELDKDKFLIRQGQEADSFYFLLSGKMATVLVSYAPYSTFRNTATHGPGEILGEDGINQTAPREYSLCTIEKCRLIAVNISEFHEQCLEPPPGESTAPHIVFLSQLNFMRFFPMHKLVTDIAGKVMLFYYISGSMISPDISDSEYVYVIYKGTCRLLAEINARKRTTLNVSLPPVVAPVNQRTGSSTFGSEYSGSRKGTTNHSFPFVWNTMSGSMTSLVSPSFTRRPTSIEPQKGLKMAETLTKSWGRRTIATTYQPGSVGKARHSLINAASIEKFVPRRNSSNNKHVISDWVHLKTLREGDVIGIESIDLGDQSDHKPARIAVVSGGAEVILMLKTFFVESTTSLMNMDLRASSYIFPDEAHLKRELSKRQEWKRFQHKVLAELRKGYKN